MSSLKKVCLSNGYVKKDVTRRNTALLEYKNNIHNVLAYLLAQVCPEKSLFPIGHGDAYSLNCFRMPINVEETTIESMRTCGYNDYAPPYGLLKIHGYFSPFCFNHSSIALCALDS